VRRLRSAGAGTAPNPDPPPVAAASPFSPSLHLKGDWLAEAGFTTGAGVTVKITDGCIVLMADNNEMQELREQIYLVKQVVEGMKSVLV